MTRGFLSDELLVHEFHLLDVDWSLSFPPFVFFPSVGFSAITAPEISVESNEIREGTSDFIHHVLGKASANALTLQKGVTPFNSDFWRWTMACLKGNPPESGITSLLTDLAQLPLALGGPEIPGKRRNMLLFHNTGVSLEGLVEAMASGSVQDKIKGAALLPASLVSGAVETLSRATGGLIDVGISSIPGKVFMLFDCLPTRYKPGSDFDASTTAVSIEELDLQFGAFEEFSISA